MKESKSFETRPYVEGLREFFSFGAVYSPIGFFLKGAYDSPQGKRVVGGFRRARTNAPIFTAYTCLTSGMFLTTYHTMKYVRQKDDCWNKIGAGVTTAGLIWHPRGLRVATRSALLYGPVGGLVFGYLYFID